MMKLAGLEPQWEEFDGVKFKLKPLTAPERLECLEYSNIDKYSLMFKTACEFGVIDWDGVEDEKGPVAFSKDLLGRLPESTWMAIARKVLRLNDLGAEDQKN